MAEVTIRVKKNGSYRVEGPVKLVDWDGNEWDLTGKEAGFSLCRCGASANRPFCDGAHRNIGFRAEEGAPKRAEGALEAKPVVNNPPASSPAKG